MKVVTVHEAKTHLSRYLAEVEATGEDILIARRDRPVARLVSVETRRMDRSGMFGAMSDRISEGAVEYLINSGVDREIEMDFYAVSDPPSC
ncbi:MAG: type II toxin-antitoxin system Phd/YefM family antitoxin [Chthoniobacterales bacterium]